MIYIILLVFLFILYSYDRKGTLYPLAVVATCFVICFGYMCGSDWRQYEQQFMDLESMSDILTSSLEPGLYLLMLFFKKLGFGYWPFTCLIKTLCLAPILLFIKKNNHKAFYLSLMFFLCFYGYYLFVDCPFRTLCAVSICSLSFINIDRGWMYHATIVFCASLFHSTSLVVIPFLLIAKQNVPLWLYVSIYFLAIFVSTQAEAIMSIMSRMPVIGAAIIQDKIDKYFVNGFAEDSLRSSPFSMGEILKLILFIWFVVNKEFFYSNKYRRYVFNGAMYFFIVAKLGAAIDLFSRFGCFFAVFYAVGLTALLNNRKLFVKRCQYPALVLLLSLLLCGMSVTADYRYVPYTNYVTYSLTHRITPSFSYRSNFNYLNSPFNK